MSVDLYRKQYRLKQHRGIPTSLVPATRARRHLTQLHNLGWSMHALEQMCALTDQGLRFVLLGDHTNIERRTHAEIMGLSYTVSVPEHIADSTYVPALGARRRMHALLALGWTRGHIQTYTADTNVSHLSRGVYDRMMAARWRDMDRAYTALHMKRGPSDLGRHRAIARGFAPPLAWDDIDNPDEKPRAVRDHSVPDHVVVDRILSGHNMPATKADRLEVIRRWEADGRPLNELDRLTGWNSRRDRRAIA